MRPEANSVSKGHNVSKNLMEKMLASTIINLVYSTFHVNQSYFDMNSKLLHSEVLLSEQKYISEQCFACQEDVNDCSVHKLAVKIEVDKYFAGPLSDRDFGDMSKLMFMRWCRKEGKQRIIRSSPSHIRLGDLLTSFCHDFSLPNSLKLDISILDHGTMKIYFNYEEAKELLRNSRFARRNYRLAPSSVPYFEKCVIMSFSDDCGSDMFCCLFGDGKYFYRDRVDQCIEGSEETSFKAKLLILRDLLEKSQCNQLKIM